MAKMTKTTINSNSVSADLFLTRSTIACGGSDIRPGISIPMNHLISVAESSQFVNIFRQLFAVVGKSQKQNHVIATLRKCQLADFVLARFHIGGVVWRFDLSIGSTGHDSNIF